jgi:flagellar biosynthesis protein FlhG
LVAVTDRYLDATLINVGTVPYDDYLRKAIKKQRPVVDAFPRSRSAMAFKNLAQKADKWPRPDAATGHLEFFVERLIRSQQAQPESRI